MPIETYVENGQLVGYLPSTGHTYRVPLRDIVGAARAELSADELMMLDGVSGDTVGAALDEVVGGKIARKLKKAIKKVAKNKLVKGLVSMVKKAVPPPFNIAVKAAEGAAKFAGALGKKKPKTKAAKAAKAKAKRILPAVRAAAAGRISPKALTKAAKKAGVKPSIAADAAVMKRVAIQARTNPQAAATLRLSRDLTSTVPADQARAAEAIEDNEYAEPTTSRESDDGDFAPPLEAEQTEDEQAPMTEDPIGPDEVLPFETEADNSETPETEGASVEGYGYY